MTLNETGCIVKLVLKVGRTLSEIIHMQSQFRSDIDRSSICSFDVEVITAPTKPLIHQMSRFLLIKEGKGKLKLQGNEYNLRQGTVVSILPWQTSDIIEVTEPLKYYLLKYYFDGVNSIIKSLYNIGKDRINLIDQITKHPVIHCDRSHEEVMDGLFMQIRNELVINMQENGNSGQSLSNIYVANKLIEIVLQFYRIGGLLEGRNEEISHVISNTEILQYIYNHLSEKLTLKELSAKFFLCESSISHYIKNTTGLSFFDLINEMRIGKTINFLLYTDLTMEELAEILGFVDSAHISKVFMARTGMKASEYRKTYQKVNDICKIKEKKDSYRIIDYIYRNYMKRLTPKTVADRFNLTTRQLNRVLLYQVERNYEDFLNFVRINRGTELLLSTDRSITDIALSIGYNSVKTFTRNFLKLRLMPPAAFRRTTELQEDDLK